MFLLLLRQYLNCATQNKLIAFSSGQTGALLNQITSKIIQLNAEIRRSRCSVCEEVRQWCSEWLSSGEHFQLALSLRTGSSEKTTDFVKQINDSPHICKLCEDVFVARILMRATNNVNYVTHTIAARKYGKTRGRARRARRAAAINRFLVVFLTRSYSVRCIRLTQWLSLKRFAYKHKIGGRERLEILAWNRIRGDTRTLVGGDSRAAIFSNGNSFRVIRILFGWVTWEKFKVKKEKRLIGQRGG